MEARSMKLMQKWGAHLLCALAFMFVLLTIWLSHEAASQDIIAAEGRACTLSTVLSKHSTSYVVSHDMRDSLEMTAGLIYSGGAAIILALMMRLTVDDERNPRLTMLVDGMSHVLAMTAIVFFGLAFAYDISAVSSVHCETVSNDSDTEFDVSWKESERYMKAGLFTLGASIISLCVAALITPKRTESIKSKESMDRLKRMMQMFPKWISSILVALLFTMAILFLTTTKETLFHKTLSNESYAVDTLSEYYGCFDLEAKHIDTVYHDGSYTNFTCAGMCQTLSGLDNTGACICIDNSTTMTETAGCTCTNVSAIPDNSVCVHDNGGPTHGAAQIRSAAIREKCNEAADNNKGHLIHTFEDVPVALVVFCGLWMAMFFVQRFIVPDVLLQPTDTKYYFDMSMTIVFAVIVSLGIVLLSGFYSLDMLQECVFSNLFDNYFRKIHAATCWLAGTIVVATAIAAYVGTVSKGMFELTNAVAQPKG